MATRNINTFIEHLMNEAMTTSGTAGPPERQQPGPHGTPGRQTTPFQYDPQPPQSDPTIPFFKPKPTPFDQSDEDGNIIPGRGPRRPERKPVRMPRRIPGIVQDVEGARPQDYQNPDQTFPITTPPFYKPEER